MSYESGGRWKSRAVGCSRASLIMLWCWGCACASGEDAQRPIPTLTTGAAVDDEGPPSEPIDPIDPTKPEPSSTSTTSTGSSSSGVDDEDVGDAVPSVDVGETSAASTGSSSSTTGPDGSTDPSIPKGWTCPEPWYGDAYCDCGCGAFDTIDCVDATVQSCEYCDGPAAGTCLAGAFGKCSADVLEQLDPKNNAVCLPPARASTRPQTLGW